MTEYSAPKSFDAGFDNKKLGDALKSENTIKIESLPSVLNEALVAFDYPAFDEYMYGYLNLLKSVKDGEKAVIEDRVLSIDAGYALERADRLGMINGVFVEIRGAEEYKKIKNSVLYRAEKYLLDVVSELICASDSYVSKIFGFEMLERIKAERDIRRRIRSYGMIIQTERWITSYPIVLVK